MFHHDSNLSIPQLPRSLLVQAKEGGVNILRQLYMIHAPSWVGCCGLVASGKSQPGKSLSTQEPENVSSGKTELNKVPNADQTGGADVPLLGGQGHNLGGAKRPLEGQP